MPQWGPYWRGGRWEWWQEEWGCGMKKDMEVEVGNSGPIWVKLRVYWYGTSMVWSGMRLWQEKGWIFRTLDALFWNLDFIQRIYQNVFCGMVLGKKGVFYGQNYVRGTNWDKTGVFTARPLGPFILGSISTVVWLLNLFGRVFPVSHNMVWETLQYAMGNHEKLFSREL